MLQSGLEQESKDKHSRKAACLKALAVCAADPVLGFLKSKQGGLLTSDLKWNFTKFLVNKEGEVVKR